VVLKYKLKVYRGIQGKTRAYKVNHTKFINWKDHSDKALRVAGS